MTANINDKITDTRNAARPNSAKVASPRSSGGTSLSCDNLTGWPTASKVHFVTYQIDSNLDPIAGTQLDCYGIVSGNNIGSLVVVDGNDTGNSTNDVVEMLPTAAWGQDLADALTHQHSRIGAHVGITNTGGLLTDTLHVTGSETEDSGLTVAGILHAQSTSIFDGAISGDGYSMATISNPYKFSVYRNAALNIGTADTKVTFDTENFDSNNNFSGGTYTAPVAGFYYFSTNIITTTAGTGTSITLNFYKNGARVTGPVRQDVTSGLAPGLSLSDILQLAANDTVEVYAGSGAAAKALDVSSPTTNNKFSGFLISKT